MPNPTSSTSSSAYPTPNVDYSDLMNQAQQLAGDGNPTDGLKAMQIMQQANQALEMAIQLSQMADKTAMDAIKAIGQA